MKLTPLRVCAACATRHQRYAAEENTSFDWYLDYELLKPVLEPYLRADADFEVYIPGCGNSGAWSRESIIAAGPCLANVHEFVMRMLLCTLQASALACTRMVTSTSPTQTFLASSLAK